MRLLLVEDDAEIADLVARLLAPSRYIVEHAATRAAALSRLKDDLFDVVIIDGG